jgi:hypothetical protein
MTLNADLINVFKEIRILMSVRLMQRFRLPSLPFDKYDLTKGTYPFGIKYFPRRMTLCT